ncbi:MAG: hypothetical protein ABSD38_32135 [Syntrophorhabdales bacterium]|jgi:hypothetical protein
MASHSFIETLFVGDDRIVIGAHGACTTFRLDGMPTNLMERSNGVTLRLKTEEEAWWYESV